MSSAPASRGPTLAEIERLYDTYFGSPLATEHGLEFDNGKCPDSDRSRCYCTCPNCEAERRLNAQRIGVVLVVRAYRAERERLLETYPIPCQARYEALTGLIDRAFTQIRWVSPAPPARRFRDDFDEQLRAHRHAALVEWMAVAPGLDLVC